MGTAHVTAVIVKASKRTLAPRTSWQTSVKFHSFPHTLVLDIKMVLGRVTTGPVQVTIATLETLLLLLGRSTGPTLEGDTFSGRP